MTDYYEANGMVWLLSDLSKPVRPLSQEARDAAARFKKRTGYSPLIVGPTQMEFFKQHFKDVP